MKKIIVFVLILIGVLIYLWMDCSTPNEQMSDTIAATDGKEFISQFKYGENISVNMSYIEPFDENLSEEFQNMETTVLKDTIVVNTRSGDTYVVKMLALPDWDIRPGDFHCVEIYKGENKIYEMKRMQAWGELPVGIRPRKKKTEYCRSVNVVDDTVVLLFSGASLLEQPIPMSIVVVKGENAKLVFNQSCFIGSSHIGFQRETHNGIKINTEYAHLDLFYKKAKYDDRGKLVQQPVVRKLHITEEGIWFESDELNR